MIEGFNCHNNFEYPYLSCTYVSQHAPPARRVKLLVRWRNRFKLGAIPICISWPLTAPHKSGLSKTTPSQLRNTTCSRINCLLTTSFITFATARVRRYKCFFFLYMYGIVEGIFWLLCGRQTRLLALCLSLRLASSYVVVSMQNKNSCLSQKIHAGSKWKININ